MTKAYLFPGNAISSTETRIRKSRIFTALFKIFSDLYIAQIAIVVNYFIIEREHIKTVPTFEQIHQKAKQRRMRVGLEEGKNSERGERR